MSGNGRLITPNQMNVTTTYADGPLAQPSSLPLQTQNGVQVLVLGGLTKVEQLAGQIAAAAFEVAKRSQPEYVMGQSNVLETARKVLLAQFHEEIATSSVDIAEAILAECARRREAAKETA